MIKFLGAPFIFGQNNKSLSEAPHFFRQEGILNLLSQYDEVEDLGDLPLHIFNDHIFPESSANAFISDRVASINTTDSFLLTVGGDHGMALGSVHGLLQSNSKRVIIWADAHADLNTTESSISGNFHGMPLSFLLNLKGNPIYPWIKHHLSASQLIYFGPRSLDPFELKIIRQLGIQYYSSEDINQFGSESILKKALKEADPYSQLPIHLSFDVDLLDASDMPSTGISLEHGPKFEEVIKMAEFLKSTSRFQSMDLVEFDPRKGLQEDIKTSKHRVFSLMSSFFDTSK